MKRLTTVFATLAMLLTTSCASMFTGTTDDVHLTSMPAGANVYEGKKLLGRTPFLAQVKRSTDELVFDHPQHGKRTVALDSKFQWGYLLLDLLFSPGYGVVGITVDTVNQAWWDHPASVTCDFLATKDRKAPGPTVGKLSTGRGRS